MRPEQGCLHILRCCLTERGSTLGWDIRLRINLSRVRSYKKCLNYVSIFPREYQIISPRKRSMTGNALQKVIHLLSKERPLFHSEADFQHALAWAIHKNYPDVEVRLEKREVINGKEIYFDISII